MASPRVVGIWPDVAAIGRVLDYLVPDGWIVVDETGTAPSEQSSNTPTAGGRRVAGGFASPPVVRIGSVVRIPLRGRRVRGWVVALHREAPAAMTLRPIAKVSGYGPPAELVELSIWAARRWAGRRASFLRAATPPRAVPALPTLVRAARRDAPAAAPADPLAVERRDRLVAELLAAPVSVLRLPPDADPALLASALAARLRGAERDQLLALAPGPADARRLERRLAGEGAAIVGYPGGWAAAAAGMSVVGTRSAAFAPLPRLGAVVVFDEHDERFRSQRTPTWHAREVVAERARRAGVPLVLVSPVPSLEALELGPLVTMSRARERRGWPSVQVIDRRRDDDPARRGLVSRELVTALKAPGVAVAVLNRKGRARLVACRTCGNLALCDACDSALALVDATVLACPRCDTARPVVCLACGGVGLKLLRLGVARVREELSAMLGEEVVEVVGDDDGELAAARVYIGTSAVLHRVARADTVAFLDLDGDFAAPRLGAAAAVLAQCTLAARLIGGRRPGAQLVLQTRQPDHPVVRSLVRADPAAFSDAEAHQRRALGLPPFAAVALVRGAGADEHAEALRAAAASSGLPVAVQGPRDGRYLVRGRDHEELSSVLIAAGRPAQAVQIEVDPVDV